MKVTKRNGELELYNCKKIKKAIKFACDGLNVNSLKLEARFDEFLFDGITTNSIQLNLINHAKNLATASDDKWVFVAGRLASMELWSSTKAYEIPFSVFVSDMIAKGIYKHEGLLKYSKEDYDYLGTLINQEYDLQHSIASVTTFIQKYLVKGECIQQVMMVNAMIYASAEPNKEDRLKYAAEWYKLFASRKISKATPHWTGLRFAESTGSCFVLAVNDDIDSIMSNAHRVAKISKDGGGVGTYWGYVRAKGDMIGGEYGLSGGVLPMMKIFNDTIVAFNQRGKRKGAITMALPIWHKDIIEFLECRSELGDLRTKLFDTQPQIVIEDLYMNMKKQDKTQIWYTFSPHEVEVVLGFNLNDYSGPEFDDKYQQAVQAYKEGKIKVVSEIKVIELWKLILQAAIEKGVPYITWGSTLQYNNPNKHCGKAHSFNLCTESTSNFEADVTAHTCSLLSLVVGRLKSKEEIIYTARQATRILANTLTLNKTPVDISQAHVDMYRTIGVGIQGLQDYLAFNNLTYEDLDEISELAELIQYGCVLESVQLAKERGAYPMFKGSRWDTGEQFDAYIKNSKSTLTDWETLKQEVKKYGVYTSQHTSPAPNCQDPTNPVLVFENDNIVSKNLYQIFKDQNIDVTDIEESKNPQWIPLNTSLQVPTYLGVDTVSRIWYNGYSSDLIQIEFEDGNTYTYTPNHKLLVLRDNVQEWVATKDILETDEILTDEMVNKK